jgi:hypothetical protein
VTSADPAEHRAVLQGWPELGGFDPSPPALDDARAAFGSAAEAYARGADAEARAGFLRAAELIPDAAPDEYAASLEHLKTVARANAAIIARQAGA